MVNLTQFFREQFIGNVSRVDRPGNKWVVVVMDTIARRLYDGIGEVDELLQYNVKAVERLESSRPDSISDLAVYFLLPTEENVQYVLNDFQVTSYKGGSHQGGRKYHAAHLFFLAAIPDKLFTKLTDRSAKYWLTLKELNIDYYPFESRVFSLERPEGFESLFASDDEQMEKLTAMASQLKSVCLSLGGNPVIRYQDGTVGDEATGSPARILAFTLQNQLDKYLKENPEFGNPTVEGAPEAMDDGPLSLSQVTPIRPTFLILDRASDLCTPLLHDLTYQALVNDVLTITDGRRYSHKFVNGFGETKNETVILDEKDPLWNELRHFHIAEVTEKLLMRFKSLALENAAAASMLQKKENEVPTVSQMRDVVAAIPELQTHVARYSTHIELVRLATEEVGSDLPYPMAEVMEMEQMLATRLDDNGDPVIHPLSMLAPLLNDPNLPSPCKLRLLLLYVVFRDGKIGNSELSRLSNHAGLSEVEIKAFERFQSLFRRFQKEVPKSSSTFFPSFFQSEPAHPPTHSEEEPIYAYTRYIPPFKKLLLEAAQQSLPVETFPYTVPENDEALSSSQLSLRVARPKWQKKQRRTEATSADQDFEESSYKGRLIVFVVGGLTYSELRWVYEVARQCQRDILVGGTNILTPNRFLSQLQGCPEPTLFNGDRPSPSPALSNLSANSSSTSVNLDDLPISRSTSEGSSNSDLAASSPSSLHSSSFDPSSLHRSNSNRPTRRPTVTRSPRPQSSQFVTPPSRLKHTSYTPNGPHPPALPPRRTQS